MWTVGVGMHVRKLGEHLHLIDVEPAGLENFVASYVLRGTEAAIVESGPASSVPNLLLGLKQIGVGPEEVSYVAVSHVHLDHGGGVGALVERLPRAKVVVHSRGAPHLAHPEKLWQQSKEVLGGIAEFYGEPVPVPEDRIMPASDGMTLDLGQGVGLRVVETLGHASHHQSYLETFGGGVFPGDAAGIYLSQFDTVVPTTPAPFRLDIALASLDKLAGLGPTALYYSHFGPASHAVERLRAYADQLRLWARIVSDAIAEKQGVEQMRERIIRGDASIGKAVGFIDAHPVLGETVFGNSVKGIAEFVAEHPRFLEP